MFSRTLCTALVCATVKLTYHTQIVMIDTFHEKASARLLETTRGGAENSWNFRICIIQRNTRAFIKGTSEINIEAFYLELRVFFHLRQKRNARFRASLLIERSGLWHLGTGKRSRSTALYNTFGKCTSLNIVHKFIHSSAFLAILTNCMLLSFNLLLCSL